MTTPPFSPVFWRDKRIPFVELRKVADGRHVCYALHSHPHWSLGAIINGKSTFRYRNDNFAVGAGDLVVMNPEWAHACNPIDNHSWSYLMMYVDTQWLTNLRFQAGLLPTPVWLDLHTAVLSDNRWFDRYCHLADCLLNTRSAVTNKQGELEAFLSGLMHELATQPINQQPATADVLTQLSRYIDQYATEDVSLETLCALSGFSEGHLIRSFKQAFGFTPHAYLVNRRVQLGQSQLKKGTPIAEVALNAGFSDQPHFQRAFKRRVAATPNQYRLGSANEKIHAADSK
ncbi:AraC family transcriptional regulator [Marinobacter psychrophilus]|uniref:AraC family transcriptional regulator n=1 Tax=Marinobacter psychrophilus TaxID=330734 RepID=A0A0H4IB46_9GAMM|nr:AraC family transcriptional regulator [Marinobacter psychrophilus]AKO52262.1 AraC family transcriptional regulator [Marinobacter psychrophilus]